MITDIFLDCDGVLFDFTNAALRAHGVTEEQRDSFPRGEYSLGKLLGISEALFWVPLDGPEFWDVVPAYLGAVRFVAELHTMLRNREKRTGWTCKINFCTMSSLDLPAFTNARFRALTTLMRDVNSFDPRICPHRFPLYIAMHGTKGIYGGAGRLLVDDYPKNCMDFERAGGKAILVPMPWNTKSKKASYDGPDYGKLLRKIKKEIG